MPTCTNCCLIGTSHPSLMPSKMLYSYEHFSNTLCMPTLSPRSGVAVTPTNFKLGLPSCMYLMNSRYDGLAAWWASSISSRFICMGSNLVYLLMPSGPDTSDWMLAITTRS